MLKTRKQRRKTNHSRKQQGGSRESAQALEKTITNSLSEIQRLSQHANDFAMGESLGSALDDALSVPPRKDTAANIKLYASELLKDGIVKRENQATPAHLASLVNIMETLAALKNETDKTNKLAYRYIQMRIASEGTVSGVDSGVVGGRYATRIPRGLNIPPPSTFAVPAAQSFAAGNGIESNIYTRAPKIMNLSDFNDSSYFKKD